MPRTEKYFVGPALLSDIRKTITRVAGMPDSANAPGFRTAATEMPRRGGLALRRGTFTATSWPIGGQVVVTVQGSTETVSVTNYCMPIVGQSGQTQRLNVIFGSVMGTTSVVEVEQPTCTLSVGSVDFTKLPGYQAGAIQLLGHGIASTQATSCSSGLQWFSITQCGTAA